MASNRGGSKTGGYITAHHGNLLDLIKLVHGHGSGINADLLDGFEVSSMLRAMGKFVGDWNSLTTPGIYSIDNIYGGGNSNYPAGCYQWGVLVVYGTHVGSSDFIGQMYISHSSGNSDTWVRGGYSTGTDWKAWSRLWSNNNFDPARKLSKSGDTLDADGALIFPNSGWEESLQIGGKTWIDSSKAGVAATDGNLHLDPKVECWLHLNHYRGNGVHFGNGAQATVAKMDNTGQLYKSSDNTVPYWNAANDGHNSGLDADTLDGYHAASFAPAGYGLGTTAQWVESADMNTVRSTGFYQGYAMANCPPGSHNHKYFIVMQHHNAWLTQICVDFNNSGTYVRTLSNSVWTEWRRLDVSHTSQLVNDSGFETTSGAQTRADSALTAANSYTDTKIANLISSSPDTLNTLNELATALGNDPNFATSIANQIGSKVGKGGDTMTGTLYAPAVQAKFYVDSVGDNDAAGAPWYGLSRTSVKVEESEIAGAVQLAGHFGIILKTGVHNLVIPRIGANMLFDGNTVWHSGNDGHNSGLDADTLDGRHLWDLMYTTNADIRDTNWNQYVNPGVYAIGDFGASTNCPPADQVYQYGTLLVYRSHNNGTYGIQQIYTSHYGDMWQRGGWNDANGWTSWHCVWTSKNFDPNSKINDTGDTITGNYFNTSGKFIAGSSSSPTDNINTTGGAEGITIAFEVRSNGSKNPGIGFLKEGVSSMYIYSDHDSINIFRPTNEATPYAILKVQGNTVWHAGNFNPATVNADKLDGFHFSEIWANMSAPSRSADIGFCPAAPGGNVGIVFNSNINNGSDSAWIRWYDDNNTYAFWGDAVENGALVIGVGNDDIHYASDVIALASAGAVIVDAPKLMALGDISIKRKFELQYNSTLNSLDFVYTG